MIRERIFYIRDKSQMENVASLSPYEIEPSAFF